MPIHIIADKVLELQELIDRLYPGFKVAILPKDRIAASIYQILQPDRALSVSDVKLALKDIGIKTTLGEVDATLKKFSSLFKKPFGHFGIWTIIK